MSRMSGSGVLATNRVLIAVHDIVERTALRTTLEQNGAWVREAKDGYEALSLARWRRFDAGVLDLNMPVVDGIEAAAGLRHPDCHQATSPGIALLALTPEALSPQNLRLIGAGFDEFVEKPVQEDILLDKLKQQISRRAPYRATPAVRDQAHALRATGGDRELADELFQMLRDQLPDQREQIVELLQAGDHESVEALVHKLRGSARYCGAMALQAAGEMLEQSLRLDEVHRDAAVTSFNRAVDQLLSLDA